MNDMLVVFGGSFNPPTCAHFSLAEQIVDLLNVEKILFMPVGDKYNKNGLVEAKHRIAMLNTIIEKNPKFDISYIEVMAERALFTVETLRILQKEHPNKKIAFVIGTDNLKDLIRWEKKEELLQEFYMIVLQRGQEKNEEIIDQNPFLREYKHKFILVNGIVEHGGNSTDVRRLLKEGVSIRYLVPNEIYHYILEHQLYRKDV